VILSNKLFKLPHQSEEEAGSAGEQPASNKIDAYTANGNLSGLPFVYLLVCLDGFSKLICRLTNTHTIL
jgi:hypothetical protein